MLKVYKFLLLLAVVILAAESSFAASIPVKVKLEEKVRAYSYTRQIGDTIEMTVSEDVYKNGNLYIKKGEPAQGVLTELENTRTDTMGRIIIENIKTHNVNHKTVKLEGGLYKKCENYANWQCFIIFGNPVLNKGEEFTLYLKE